MNCTIVLDPIYMRWDPFNRLWDASTHHSIDVDMAHILYQNTQLLSVYTIGPKSDERNRDKSHNSHDNPNKKKPNNASIAFITISVDHSILFFFLLWFCSAFIIYLHEKDKCLFISYLIKTLIATVKSSSSD